MLLNVYKAYKKDGKDTMAQYINPLSQKVRVKEPWISTFQFWYISL